MEQMKVQAVRSSELPRQAEIQHRHKEPRHLPLPWIETVKNQPYFVTDKGETWTPIGQNDAITWPELKGLFRRKDTASAERYIAMLAEKGITCMRLMLEYCQGHHRYLENPVGQFNPNMVRLWDDIFLLCEKYGIRILLTPYDTFWMWRRWKHHPYHRTNGGVCDKRSQWLLCKETRAAIKQRLRFVTERWGGSGVLFAWDLWNEINPAHAGNSAGIFADFVQDVGGFLRQTELQLHGKAHPQTVSVFGPVLKKDSLIADCIFRHPQLDFASVHFYESKTIDHPKNTVDAAISMGRLTKEALAEINDNRPFFDSEHGPIHAFKDRRITLSEAFDDEYFRHMQWAHLASGGAGGGMRWPNRHPHSLTAGMRTAQQSMANFLPFLQWTCLQRSNWNEQIFVSNKAFIPFGCGDENQSIVWLLRGDTIGRKKMLRTDADPVAAVVSLPMTRKGHYTIVLWDTKIGRVLNEFTLHHYEGNELCVPVPSILTDIAIAVRRQTDTTKMAFTESEGGNSN